MSSIGIHLKCKLLFWYDQCMSFLSLNYGKVNTKNSSSIFKQRMYSHVTSLFDSWFLERLLYNETFCHVILVETKACMMFKAYHIVCIFSAYVLDIGFRSFASLFYVGVFSVTYIHFAYFWQDECSVLLEALEQSVFNPEIVCVLAKSLLHVLQLSPEKSISSFKTLNALPLVLKVASILAQETRRPDNMTPSSETVSGEGSPPQSLDMSNSIFCVQKLQKSVEMTMEIFAQFFSSTDDEKSCILCNSSCIDCLFDLFWEEALRTRILSYILELMKVRLFASCFPCLLYMVMFACELIHLHNVSRLLLLMKKHIKLKYICVPSTWRHLLTWRNERRILLNFQLIYWLEWEICSQWIKWYVTKTSKFRFQSWSFYCFNLYASHIILSLANI